MRGGHINSRNQTELFLQKVRRVLGQGLLLSAVAAGTAMLGGCTGLVSGASSSGNPPSPSTLVISNIQTATITTSSSQIVWATNVPANSSVDYGTTTAYGNSTPVDSTMVTSHQVTISGLAAGTTYYYQVNSSDSKGNNGHSGAVNGRKWGDRDIRRCGQRHDDGRQLRELHIGWITERDIHDYSQPRGLYVYAEQPEYDAQWGQHYRGELH